jgi:hypothetical protein
MEMDEEAVMKKKKFMAMGMMLAVSMMLTACQSKGEDAKNPDDGSGTKNSPAPTEMVKKTDGSEPGGESESETKPGEDGEKETANLLPEQWQYLTEGAWRTDEVGMACFYHFNGDLTYYGSFFAGAMTEAGTYEIVEEEKEYIAGPGEDGEMGTEDDVLEKAPAFVRFTSYDGKVQEAAIVDGTFPDISFGGMANHRALPHDAAYQYVASEEEIPIVIAVYYADNEEGNSLTLYHDKSFVDYSGTTGLEGTWEKKEDGSFILTTDEGQEMSLVPGDGGAKYTAGSETVVLAGKVSHGDVVCSFRMEGVENTGLPMAVNLRIDCKDDNTCQLIVEVAAVNAELLADEGTYEVGGDMFSYTFHFKTAGDIQSEADYTTATANSIGLKVPYKADVTVEFSGTETPLSINTVLEGTVTIG